MAWSMVTENEINYATNPDYLGGRKFAEADLQSLTDKLSGQLSRCQSLKSGAEIQVSRLASDESMLTNELANIAGGLAVL